MSKSAMQSNHSIYFCYIYNIAAVCSIFFIWNSYGIMLSIPLSSDCTDETLYEQHLQREWTFLCHTKHCNPPLSWLLQSGKNWPHLKSHWKAVLDVWWCHLIFSLIHEDDCLCRCVQVTCQVRYKYCMVQACCAKQAVVQQNRRCVRLRGSFVCSRCDLI